MTDIIADTGRGEQLVLDVRSSAPSNPDTYQAWIRDDLTSGEQIGALEFGDGTQVPIYPDTVAVSDNVTKALQVPIGGQMGFIPTAPVADASYDARRFPFNGADYGLHNATSLSAIPDSGVSYYTFDDSDTSGSTTVDSWGDYDGTINGATTGVSGEYSQAYSFDGTDDDVQVGSTQAFSDFSWSAWFKLDSLTDSAIISSGSNTDAFSGPTLEYQASSGLRLGHFSATGSTDVESGVDPTTGVWNHVVATHSTSNADLYLNGSSVGSETQSTTTGTLVIEIAQRSNDSYYFNGDLDEIKIYDKVLTSNEVSDLYNNRSI